MKVSAIAIGSALSLTLLGEGIAQDYPNKPVRLIVGSNMGGGPDTLIRTVAGPLGDMWKQQIVVENRPSPGGIDAAYLVAKAAPDGYTLLMCAIGSHGIAPVLNRKLPYDYIKDFTPVSKLGAVANGLIVNPSLPAKTVKEFVAHAKANPGKLQYGSSGVGNSPHLTMELFRSMAGISLVHVALPPGQIAPNEVAEGRVDAAFGNMPAVVRNSKAGKVRALAVTSAARNAQLPEVPTMIESGYAGFEVSVWSGVCGPAALPKPVVARINADLGKVLSMPDTRKRYAEQGAEPVHLAPEQFGAFIRAENAKWVKAAKTAGLEAK